MALRINTNTSALSALRALHETERAQDRSVVRLSTGLRINSAADDPAGVVQANKLRSQLAGLDQALANTRTDNNLLATADAGLGQMEELLDGIRGSVLFALNGGAADADQIAAEQDSVDQALAAIDRIANTTKFGGVSLLDGSVSNRPTTQSGEITQINVQNIGLVDPTTSQTFRVQTVALASQALLAHVIVAQTNTAIIRVTGNLGSEDIALGSNATAAQVQSTINGIRFNTGVYISGANFRSFGYGSDQFLRIELVAGTYASAVGSDFGRDMEAYVNGLGTVTRGSEITVNSSAITATIEINPTSAVGVYTFSVAPKAGLRFQLNDTPGGVGGEQLGLAAVTTGALGSPAITPGNVVANRLGGFLAELAGGQGNDLVTNATNALRIVDAATSMLSDIRAFIGSFQSNVLERNETALGVQIENLSAAESDIRDVDFASETTEFTKNQILFQSGTAILAQANLIPQNVLALLQ